MLEDSPAEGVRVLRVFRMVAFLICTALPAVTAFAQRSSHGVDSRERHPPQHD
jgi:hypothetical protein